MVDLDSPQMTIKYGAEKMLMAGPVTKGTNRNTNYEFLILAAVRSSTK